MSTPSKKGKGIWQYHPRSDHHSKVPCWAIVFDLMLRSSLLREHIAAGKVGFGINHAMRDFRSRRKKNLDLVLATPGAGKVKRGQSFQDLVDKYHIQLRPDERRMLADLPVLEQASVGSVHLALEAKACMTAHQKALPRLYDELNSSHDAVHGASDLAIAAGLVMINLSEEFISPTKGNESYRRPSEISKHVQPRMTDLVIEKVHEVPRRTFTGKAGFDALAITVVRCRNDGSPVEIVEGYPAPLAEDPVSYEMMLARVEHLYQSRFPHV